MKDFKKDIIMRLTFIIGFYSFISGEFILSNLLFAGAAIYTNVLLTYKLR